MAATALVRLGKLCGRADYLDRRPRARSNMAVGVMEKSATASGQLLLATDLWLGPTHESVVVGAHQDPATAEVLDALRRRFLPRTLIASRDGTAPRRTILRTWTGCSRGSRSPAPSPTLYVCQDFTCQAPAIGRDAALKALDNLS